jgi:hypothetical protein
MSTNMTLIETKTVGSGGSASISFTSIPATYTDLKLVASIRTTQANIWSTTLVSFNGSSSNLSWRRLIGDGSAPDSGSGSTGLLDISNGASSTSNTFSNFEMYIPNYTSTSNAKSYSVDSVNENNGTTAYSSLLAGLWNPGTQAAITSIGLTPGSGSFVEFTSFSLYGISSVTSTPKATGGIVSQDATYWYHMFPFTSTFTPTAALSADILCIAGGGGGAVDDGAGGGGAGGLRLLASQSLTTSGYTITVGGGGTGAPNGSTTATDGANSSISGSGLTTITTTGGGRGGGYSNATVRNGASGGSGGGGGNNGGSGGAGNAGSYSPVEGYAGGNGYGTTSGSRAGGGGGGAASAGTTPTSTVGGAGGTGASSYNSISFSSWLNSTFTGVNGLVSAGGTGGASGTGNGTSGVANSGNGGGGAGSSGTQGGNGGSGLVIVRYAK